MNVVIHVSEWVVRVCKREEGRETEGGREGDGGRKGGRGRERERGREGGRERERNERKIEIALHYTYLNLYKKKREQLTQKYLSEPLYLHTQIVIAESNGLDIMYHRKCFHFAITESLNVLYQQ